MKKKKNVKRNFLIVVFVIFIVYYKDNYFV